MRWVDIETKYADTGASELGGLLTHGARVALGLPALTRDRKAAVREIAGQILGGWDSRHDFASKGCLALLAALEGEWDLVGDCTGGALPNRVTLAKTYGFDVARLARHLATVARAKLPATHALVAITAVRDQFAAGGQGLDPRAAVLATQLFVRDIVRSEQPIEATRRWLEGDDIEIEVVRSVAAPADGEDPRVKIFERYADELSDEAAIAGGLRTRIAYQSEDWGRHLEAERIAVDDLVIRAMVGRIPLPAEWARVVDPAVAAWLDVELPTAPRRFADLATLRSAEWILAEWQDAVFALVTGTRETFAELVESKKLPRFRPGQFFKDDARKLIKYIASAIAASAHEVDVLPAWFDFLSRRSPATTPRLTGQAVELRWKHLLIIEAGISRLAGRPRGEIGRALQHHVSGA